jgi:rod shape-determining protein MreC
MQQKNFWKSKLFIVLVVLALFTLFTTRDTGGFFSPIQSLGQTLFLPFQEVGSVFGYSVRSVTGIFEGVTKLKNENRELQKKNLELMAKNAALEQMGTENIELRRNLDLLPSKERQFIAASITTKDPSGVQNFFTVNKGSDQGVREGMAVVVEAGVLIGRVTKVFSDSATVTLLTNQDSVVNVETSKAAIRGVAKGEQGLNMKLAMVEQGKELTVGDGILTSGLGGEYPRGLLVGTISDIGFSEDKLFQQATISSPVRINSLRFVFLLQ